jgi:hypothetical protein
MAKLSQIFDAHRALVGNVTLSRGALAIGTVKSGINTANAITYAVNGVIPAAKGAMTSQALTAGTGPVLAGQVNGRYVQPAGTTVYYVVCLDIAGAVTCVQGTYNGQPLGGPGVIGDGSIPDIPSNVTPFGVIKVVTTGAATFTLGTTLFDATNVTTTFFDVHMLPDGVL